MNAGTERVLSGAEVRTLSERSDLHGAVQTGLHLALIAGAGVLVALSGPWTVLPAVVLLGAAQAALFAPIHETMHLTAFRSRRANQVVGWIVAAPSLLNWHFYAPFHLAHHRFTQDPERDPELTPMPPGTRFGWLKRVLAIPYWMTRARVIAACWRGDLSAFPYIPEKDRTKVIRSVRAMSVAVPGTAVLAGAAWGWTVPLLYWVGPQLLGQPLLRMYLLTEHTGCTHDRNGLTNTRTVLTNWIMRRLMWNMPYHTEHHLYPSIPFHRLPDAHRAVRDRLGVVQQGYARWQVQFVRGLKA